jgi:hypothetical protein
LSTNVSVSLVAGAGQALGGDAALLGPRGGLQHVEEPEPHRLLELVVAVQLDVRAPPEVVQVGLLVASEALPAGVPRLGQRRLDLVAH